LVLWFVVLDLHRYTQGISTSEILLRVKKYWEEKEKEERAKM
jgi:hypothetical protein